MAGPAALTVLLSTSTLLALYLLLLVPDPAAVTPHRRSGRHYMPFLHVAFGPFATKLELLLHGAIGGGEHHRGAIPDNKTWYAARCFGSDGELKVRERLLYLFLMLDRAPKDGGVSHAELEAWLRRQAADRLHSLTRRELKKHDKDGDGAVTLRDYLAVDADQHVDWSNTEHGEPGWWLHKFTSAD